MTKRLQLGWMALALMGFTMICAAGGGEVWAQQSQDRPPQKQKNLPPKATPQRPAAQPNAGGQNLNRQGASRPPARQSGPQANRQTNRQVDRPSGNQVGRSSDRNDNRPPSATGAGRSNDYNSRSGVDNRNSFNNRPNDNSSYGNRTNDHSANNDRPPSARIRPRPQVGVGAPRPFVDRMRDLSPQQRDRVLESSKAFHNLAPEQQNRIRQQFNQWDGMNAQQRADLRTKEDTWRRMTPQQRDYVKNQVLPKWRQIPWERQQVIQQKLGVLQNMPEYARNQRLSDPNFTRGMSDEDKATLHDLSHLHVGGAPDPPGNEQ